MEAKVITKEQQKIQILKGELLQYSKEQREIESVLNSGLSTLLYTDVMEKKERLKKLGKLIGRKIGKLYILGVEIEVESLRVA